MIITAAGSDITIDNMNIKARYKLYYFLIGIAAAALLFISVVLFSALSAMPDASARYVLSHSTLSGTGQDFYDYYIRYINPYVASSSDAVLFRTHKEDTLSDRADDIKLLLSSVCSNFGTRFKGIICVRAGNELNAETLSEAAGQDVTPVTSLSSIHTDDIGYYRITVECKGRLRSCVLIITDPDAPKIKMKSRTLWVGETPDIKSFIVTAEDSTVLYYYYETEPRCDTAGRTEFTVSVRDRGGNMVSETLDCEVREDDEPPVISGARDRTCHIGDTVLYKEGVKVTDNRDGSNVRLEIDISKVDPNSEGKYPVRYTATDSTGLTTTVTVMYTFEYTKEEALINRATELAKPVINKIIKDGMTDREKAAAIYRWVRSNIHYVYTSDKSNWYQGAIDGFQTHKGDCFTYAAVSKVLFTQAGIENIEVTREYTPKRPNTHHFWNMVKIDGEWYHYDATPRVDSHTFFLVTSDWLLAFSREHRDSHLFDPSKYPQTP